MLASSRMLLLPHSYEAVVKLLLDMGASTRTPRTLMVGRCCRGPQRTGTEAVVKLLQSRGALSL